MSRWINETEFLVALVNKPRYSSKTIGEALDEASSIDIVRCGECKYKRLYDDGETKYYYCALEDRPNRQWSVDDTDFCSWGEREGE